MIAVREGGGEAIQGVGEEATMAEGEDLGEEGGGEVASEAILVEVLVKVRVEGQVLEAVLGTMQWVSLAEDMVIVEVVADAVEGLEEIWEVLEVVVEIEALEADLEVGAAVGEEGKDSGASRWIPTPLEELRDPSTLTRLRRTKAPLTPLRCKDHMSQIGRIRVPSL